MKTLYLIGGTMGVGKTTACQALKTRLPACAFLDADWCWDMHPFVVNEETKALVMDNITHHLNAFLHCSAFDNVVFCWVMHEQSIIDDILALLDLADVRVIPVSLVCSEEALSRRLMADIQDEKRQPDVLARSIARLPMYEVLDTIHLDVSALTPEETARAIEALAAQPR